MKNLSRSEFLKSAGFAGIALGTAGVMGATAAVADEAWDKEVDVVVCGCGTGGTPAAIEAHDAGAEVLIIEKKDWIGGSMRRCGGAMLGADTCVQHALGITDDDPEMLYEYLLACGEGLSDPALVRVLADNAGKNIDWVIQDLGGQPAEEWAFSTLEDEGEEICIKAGLNVSGTPVYFDKFEMPEFKRQRCHWFNENPEDIDPTGDRYYADYSTRADGTWTGRGGTGLWKPFGAALEERGIEIMTETTLQHLIVGEGNEVLGVIAENGGQQLRIKARKGVVLATGGFTRNAQMLHDYRCTEFVEPDVIQMQGGSPAPGECDGASLLAAFEIGAGVNTISCGNGGLKINTDAQVIDVFGNPIPRLYASSKAIGGVYGNLYPSCGAYISAFVCFGRIAGQNVGKLEPVA